MYIWDGVGDGFVGASVEEVVAQVLWVTTEEIDGDWVSM